METQESQLTIIDNVTIYNELGSDALGVNYKGGEENSKKQSLVTEVYSFLYSNPIAWKKINALLEGIKKTKINQLYSPEKITQFEDKYFLFYPLIKGLTLENILHDATRKKKPLNFDLTFSILFAIAEILDIGSSILISGEKSHHGFLTPDNIYLDYNGGVYLKNYGIYPYLIKDEKINSALEKQYGIWMAPELLRKEKDVSQTDIYYLGYIAYKILTGKYFMSQRDEDFDNKFSNLRFIIDIPSADTDFLNNMIAFFKKTLHPEPAQRFANIKEFKQFIASRFHIEDLSKITFNLSYYMNFLYSEPDEIQTPKPKPTPTPAAVQKEAEKKEQQTPPTPVPSSPKPQPAPRIEPPTLFTSHMPQKNQKPQKPKPKRWMLLSAIIAVMIVSSIYIIVSQKKQLKEQQKQQTQSTVLLERNKKKFESELAQLKEKYLKQLREIELKKANTLEEKKAKEESIKKLDQMQKEETRKTLEKQKAKLEEIKNLEQEPKKNNPEIVKEPPQEQPIAKKIEEPLKTEEKTVSPTPVPESTQKKEPEKTNDESQKVTEGQLVSIFLVSEKPELMKGDSPVFPPSIQRKHTGLRLTIRVMFLVTETGNVGDIRILTKIPGDLESFISKSLKNWKFKPARKNNVRIKVWYPLDIKIVF
ncbi:MAG: protein kinase domain-containing protein [Candidatus Omnitrophota bacterium]